MRVALEKGRSQMNVSLSSMSALKNNGMTNQVKEKPITNIKSVEMKDLMGAISCISIMFI